MDASVTNLGFRGGLEAYPSLQRYGMMCHLRKKRKKKNRKKEEKEKGLPFQPGGGGQSRFCLRKLCPEGFIFEGQTAQPPDLDGPSETGYLCGSFFLKTVLYCIGSIRYPHLSATLRIFSKSKGQLSPNSSETRNSIPSELIKGSLNFQRCSHCLSFSFSF